MAVRKIVGILQARMGSTRLPGKIVAPVLGRPMLNIILERTMPSRLVDEWVVATTSLPQDDVVERLVVESGVACYRGHPEDCLDRYYRAATTHSASVVVRLTGDNPLVDAGLVDWVVDEFRQTPSCDYASNALSRTFPLGLSAEVFSYDALATAWGEDASSNREHVTPYIYMNPQQFSIRALTGTEDYSRLRWTVDTDEDLQFVRQVFGFFNCTDFTWQEALRAVLAHPDWSASNAHAPQRAI